MSPFLLLFTGPSSHHGEFPSLYSLTDATGNKRKTAGNQQSPLPTFTFQNPTHPPKVKSNATSLMKSFLITLRWTLPYISRSSLYRASYGLQCMNSNIICLVYICIFLVKFQVNWGQLSDLLLPLAKTQFECVYIRWSMNISWKNEQKHVTQGLPTVSSLILFISYY